ncbi:hypothetical protein ACRYI5_03465 [Furfurilactobacillus sp. WILCCON 0119]
MHDLNDFTNELLSQCLQEDIQVKWADLNSTTPPASNPKSRTIVMNLNWQYQRQIPFQLAHEMEHIKHQDDQFAILYFGTNMKVDFERAANTSAIYDLAEIYLNNLELEYTLAKANYADFTKTFGIPAELTDIVIEAFTKFAHNRGLHTYLGFK